MRVFIENQKFNQWWLRVLMAFAVSSTIIPGIFFFNDMDENSTLEIVIIFGVLLISLVIIFGVLFILKLNTKIDTIGIHYGFYPIHQNLKTIRWGEIEKCYVRKYNPLTEFGGWGYRGGFSNKTGKAFNVKGNIGIQLVLKNGKKILIGTQKQSEAEHVISYYNSENKKYEVY